MLNYWAGCISFVSCFEEEFKRSECFDLWQDDERAGFVWEKKLQSQMREAVLVSSKDFSFNVTENNLDQIVVIEWAPNPRKKNNILFK